MTMSTAPETAAVPAVVTPRPGRRVPGWWRDAVGVATWASMRVVVALWVADGEAGRLGTLSAGLTSLGRLTGLVSADLLLVQVGKPTQVLLRDL